MDLSKILVISGKPDLYELISHTKNGAVVENCRDHKRQPVFSTERISSLNEITMFAKNDDVPLRDVMQNIFRKEDGKPISFDIRTATRKQLFDYLGDVLPDYDDERIYTSDVKKLYSWYNLLVVAGKVDLEKPEEEQAKEAEESTEVQAPQDTKE